MRFTSVVFPAPFGPMRPNAWRGDTARSTAFTATTPPKRLVRCIVSSNIGGPDLLQPSSAPELCDRHQTARQVNDDQQQDQPLKNVAVILQRSKQLGQRGEQGRSEDWPERIRDTADDGEDEDLNGLGEGEVVRFDREREVRRET